MSTLAQAQKLLDDWTVAKLAGFNFSMGNQDNEAFSQGTAPYVTQRVMFSKVNQLGLGFSLPGRNHGYLLFIIYNPRGTGDGGRNTLLTKVINSFRSQAIGDVTTLQARIVNQGSAGQWSLTGVQVPFYTDEF